MHSLKFSQPIYNSAAVLPIAVLFLCAPPAISYPSLRFIPEKVFSVDRFGAVGNGLHNDTEAFIRTWRAVCSSPTPAVLKVPPNKLYQIWPITFPGPCSSNSTFLISGTIIAPENPDLWREYNPRKWILFNKLNNLTLRGGGTINGKGKEWWAHSCKHAKKTLCRTAPAAVRFHGCRNLRIKNLTLMDSQRMHLILEKCSSVKISQIKIFAPSHSPNTDGIHISSSYDIEIKNIMIKTGDDCISIASGSSMVKIRDVSCGPGHGISIGSLGNQGSWSNVSSIIVSRVIFTGTSNGFRIKTWQGGKGFARRIHFQNATMRDVSNPIIIDQYYCDSSLPCPNETSAVKVEQVSFKNIRGTSAKKVAMKFACSDESPCEKIMLKNIKLYLPSGRRASSFIWKAHVSCSGSIQPTVCNGVFDDILFPVKEIISFVSIRMGSVLNQMMRYFLI